jgi:hypothetical protein
MVGLATIANKKNLLTQQITACQITLMGGVFEICP